MHIASRIIFIGLLSITVLGLVAARRLPHKSKKPVELTQDGTEKKDSNSAATTNKDGDNQKTVANGKTRLMELIRQGVLAKINRGHGRTKRSAKKQIHEIKPNDVEKQPLDKEKQLNSGILEHPLHNENSKDRFDNAWTSVIDGRVSQSDSWKWIVALYSDESQGFACAGTLIDLRWVITAAHCVNTATVLQASIGPWNLSTTDHKDLVLVEEIHVHPSFVEYPTSMYDIALLKLERNANVNETADEILTLPDPLFNLFELNPYCFIIGWGAYDPADTTKMSTVLLQRWVNVISAIECQTRWDAGFMPVDISFTNLCVDEGVDGDISACYGDSGSPLQCFDTNAGVWKIAGISSWGSSACSTFPSVYTKVSAFMDWIYSVMYPANGVYHNN